ncbi:hypothetical protein EJB05_29840 [Eragrostis curvula]|uniref:Uncharacterized protein n=1 Tax=Eragrostis curvula TaxID=38414 RepID=A0A5J9UU23_9POAL|nr:hypothetical protein EJB05_29840 [Eragrostis curvula]
MERDPTEAPELYCACGNRLRSQVSRTPRNYLRRYYACRVCHTWIWEDVLYRFVEAMVFYTHSSTISRLQDELNEARISLAEKDSKIDNLERILEECGGSCSQDTRSKNSLCYFVCKIAILLALAALWFAY